MFSYKQDRSRQEQLARERIAAMKAKRESRKAKGEAEEKKELEDFLMKEREEDRKADQLEAMDLHEGGAVVLQEAILNEMEKKHVSEQEVGCAKYLIPPAVPISTTQGSIFHPFTCFHT